MSAHPFAPGTITRHQSRQRRALAVWLGRVATLMAVVAALAFVAGLLAGALA